LSLPSRLTAEEEAERADGDSVKAEKEIAKVFRSKAVEKDWVEAPAQME